MSVQEESSLGNPAIKVEAESQQNAHIVVPVEWGDLSHDTFSWYVDNVHCKNHYVHICHVLDFRRHLQPGMSPQAVMEIMIETNAVAEELKKVYESVLNDKHIKGKFMRVAGNNRWSAIVEYCKRVDATMLVLGSQPKLGPFQHEPQQQRQQCQSETIHAAPVTQSSSYWSCSDLPLLDVGPAFGTVTNDVLQHCDIPALVYRQPLMLKRRGSVPRRVSIKK